MIIITFLNSIPLHTVLKLKNKKIIQIRITLREYLW